MAMFTTPRNALIEPSVEEFEEQGLTDIGIIQQDHPRTNPSAKLQVASIHTAVNRELPQVALLVNDEAHMNTKEFNALLDSEDWKNKIVIALSATPWKKGMGLRWKHLVQTASLSGRQRRTEPGGKEEAPRRRREPSYHREGRSCGDGR